MINRVKAFLAMLIVALLLLVGAMVGATAVVVSQTKEEADRTEEQVEYVATLRVVSIHSLDQAERWKGLALTAVRAQFGPTYSDSVDWIPETDATEIE